MLRRNGKSRVQINRLSLLKRKIGGKKSQADIFEQFELLIFPKYREALHLWAERCFIFYSKACCDFCLVPFERDPDGKFTASQKPWRKILHYLILFVQMTSLLQKVVVLVQRLSDDGVMDLSTVLCIVSFLVFFVGYSIPTSFLLQPCVSAKFLNAGPAIVKSHGEGWQIY